MVKRPILKSFLISPPSSLLNKYNAVYSLKPTL